MIKINDNPISVGYYLYNPLSKFRFVLIGDLELDKVSCINPKCDAQRWSMEWHYTVTGRFQETIAGIRCSKCKTIAWSVV